MKEGRINLYSDTQTRPSPAMREAMARAEFVDISGTGVPARRLSAQLEQRGINVGAMGEHLLRAVTHLDVDEAMVDEAANAFVDALDRLA